ncbi:hypothetical protein R3P38DRAFT_3040354 [Favolaschia claudopus]|uniref:AAA-ATPase-like domain-containing protein n=1 Tax=Favolaschia claudopus TaxID=2862362 RepID=A0AAW0A9V5_9AGAR
MTTQPPATGRVDIHAHFLHLSQPMDPAQPHVRVTDLEFTDFWDSWRVAYILDNEIQAKHNGSNCTTCTSPILIKAAWFCKRLREPLVNSDGEVIDVSPLGTNFWPKESDPDRGAIFLAPHLLVKHSLGRGGANGVNDLLNGPIDPATGNLIVHFLCETVVDKASSSHSTVVAARKLDDADNDGHGGGKRAKLDPDLNLIIPRGLFIIPIPAHDRETVTFSLPPQSFTMEQLVSATPGTVFVDKTDHIMSLSRLLALGGSYIYLPPKTGKSTLLNMLSAFYDCAQSQELTRRVFGRREVKISSMNSNKNPATQNPDHFAGKYMCLCFDLRPLAFTITDLKGGVNHIISLIDQHLSTTIRNFVEKYRAMFPATKLPQFTADADPPEMMAKISEYFQKRSQPAGIKLFLSLDHLDDPILRTLLLEKAPGQSSSEVTTAVAVHIMKFLEILANLATNLKSAIKLLVVSNLPFSKFRLNIRPPPGFVKYLRDISAEKSLDGAFGMTLEEVESIFKVLSCNRRKQLVAKTELAHKLGYFMPRPSDKLLQPSDKLHQPPGVYNFDLVFYHAATTLELMNLMDPNLRNIDLLWLDEISQSCRHLLEYSSLRRGRDIVVPRFGEYTFEMLLHHADTEQNLYALLYHIGGVSVHDVHSTPDPMCTMRHGSPFSAYQLCGKYAPYARKYETAAQIIIRALFSRDAGPLAEYLAWSIYYTDIQDLKGMRECVLQTLWNGVVNQDARKFRDGAVNIKPVMSPEFVNNWFSQVHLHTNPNATSESIRRREPFTAGFRKDGVADGVVCGANFHPDRLIAVELKNFSLENIVFNLRYTGNASFDFKSKYQVQLDHLDTLTRAQILKLEYCFKVFENGRSTTTQLPIQYIVNKGKEQLRSYMDAIAQGEYATTEDGGTKKGFRDFRFVVLPAAPGRPDEIIGFIIYAVGRRVFWELVEPLEQNKAFKFRANEGWQGVWGSLDNI